MNRTETAGCLTNELVGDSERIAAVRRTQLLDAPAEETFDRLTRTAAKLVGAPVAFISLVDSDRDFDRYLYGWPTEGAHETASSVSE